MTRRLSLRREEALTLSVEAEDHLVRVADYEEVKVRKVAARLVETRTLTAPEGARDDRPA